MANPAPAGGPPTPADVDAVLQRLAEIPVKINRLGAARHEFMDNLGRRLNAIQQRVTAIARAIGPMGEARRDLLALRRRLVHPQAPDAIPDPESVRALDTVIQGLNPAALNQALQGLQDEVIALETAVGLSSANPPGPLAPPAGQPFHGGHKYTARSRSARAKRLKTRKRLHSLHPTRRHRRRRKHKKRTHRRRRRRKRRR